MRTLPFLKSAEWHANRATGLGGSDANKIAKGDPAELIALWEEKRGVRPPEDLTSVLPVMMGSATEDLNRFWYERQTGRTVHAEGTMFVAENPTFMRCELDGLTTAADGSDAIIECKHVNAFGSIDEVVQRYMPQLHHNMHCVGIGRALLSVFQGTQKYELFEVELDPMYLADLIAAERKFWDCVLDGTPPGHIDPIMAPVAPEAMIEVDLTGNNEFADQAATWLENRAAAKKFDGAAKSLKDLMQPNWGKAFGHGVIVSRSKANALSIKEMKNAS